MIDLITLQNSEYNVLRISSPNITELKQGEVFVFGSNKRGIHGAGAAKFAVDNFGAEWGVAEGMQGDSYAIPTKDEELRTLHEDLIDFYVGNFILYAERHPELNFLVTEIGCGLAGHDPMNIAPLFEKAFDMNNVYLPYSFWFEMI